MSALQTYKAEVKNLTIELASLKPELERLKSLTHDLNILLNAGISEFVPLLDEFKRLWGDETLQKLAMLSQNRLIGPPNVPSQLK